MRVHRHIDASSYLLCLGMVIAAMIPSAAALAAAAETTEPFADASYRESQVVTSEPMVDASYREANRVAVPATGGEGFDWTDGVIGGGVVLGILLVIGAGVGIWWMTIHRGPRHPRGPAVPSH